MKNLEKIFGITIDNPENFKRAITHPSYIQEHNLDYMDCYERLEFLGDAVLKLTVSDVLYEKYADSQEGFMSKIRSIVVSDATLFDLAKKIGLPELLLIGKHEEKQGCRQLESISACAFEAILGAYYLDGKLTEIRDFIRKNLAPYIDDVENNAAKYNAKAILQEYTQSLTKETPKYSLIEQIGPEHNKRFIIAVSYKDEIIAQGEGRTKKEAEQQAAYEACKILGVVENV